MAKPYSMDFRDRAVARVLGGESVRAVALALSVSAATVVAGRSVTGQREVLLPARSAVKCPTFCLVLIAPSFWSAPPLTSRCAVWWLSWRRAE